MSGAGGATVINFEKKKQKRKPNLNLMLKNIKISKIEANAK